VTFLEKLDARWRQGFAVCVSLDVDDRALDPRTKLGVEPQLFYYCCKVADAVALIVGAFKVNPSFFWRFGISGLMAMDKVIAYIRDRYPEVPLILDAKWADVGHTAEAQARATFNAFGCDAATAVPYGEVNGYRVLLDSGFVFLCALMGKPNDIGEVHTAQLLKGKKVWQQVVDNAANLFNVGCTCGVVVTADFAPAVEYAALANGKMPLLIPGYGAQKANGSALFHALESRVSTGRFLIVGGRPIMFPPEGVDLATHAAAKVERWNEIIQTYVV
jgi:orotidine-5'-phosphate decarboxylase